MPTAYVPLDGHKEVRPAGFDRDAHEKRLLAHMRRVWRALAGEKIHAHGVSFTIREWAALLDVEEHEVHDRLRSGVPV